MPFKAPYAEPQDTGVAEFAAKVSEHPRIKVHLNSTVAETSGALAFSEPGKLQKQIRDIVESAYAHGAEMIVTPCQLCQANVEIYQSEINNKQGTKLATPVVYYSQLMTVAYGGSLKQAGLDGQVIQPEKLRQIASRQK